MDINFYSSFQHKKWVIETTFPDWEDTFKYWDEATDHVDVVNTASNVATQSYFKEDEGLELTDRIRDYANDVLRATGAPFQLGERTLAWNIAYNVGGWQALHKHGPMGEEASVVLCLEGAGDESGQFHFMLPEPDGSMSVGFAEQKPGTFLIVESDTWHGAYPCTAPKKVFVMDFKLEQGDPNKEAPEANVNIVQKENTDSLSNQN